MKTLIHSEVIRKEAHKDGFDSIGFQFIERGKDEDTLTSLSQAKSVRRIAVIFSQSDTEEDVARKLEQMAESIRSRKNFVYGSDVLTGNEVNFHELNEGEKEAYLSADNF